jgi:hypothetical protein
MADLFADNLPRLLLWGFIATVVMTTILEASQGLGLSRLSLPFLVGTMFTAHRNKAVVIGFIVYVAGGWLFAMLYFLFFSSIGHVSWLLGAVIGAVHGVLLLAGALPLLAYAHPRMASEHDGPRQSFLLEPPGFFGLNYGRRTPMTTLLAQTLYGGTLGGLCQLGGLFSPG